MERLGVIYYEVEADTSQLVNSGSRLDKSLDSMERGFKSTDAQAGRFNGRMKKVAQGVRQANMEMGVGVSILGRLRSALALVIGAASFGKVINNIADFEQAMLGVQAVSGATEEQFAALEKQARELGATSVFSAQQAAEAQKFLAMAGFEANQVLEATPGILQLAAAAGLDLGSAADIASNALSGFKLPVRDLSRLNDVLAKTANSANTNVSQLGQALSYAAPIASAASVDLETTAAAIGTLSDAGIQGSRAGTGFLGVIRQLSKVTPEAEKALKKYGLSTKDVDVTVRGLVPVLETLAGAGISTADAFQIFGSEAGTAAQILISSEKRVKELTETLGGAEGAAQEAADKLSSGLTGSIKSLQSVISEAILGLGNAGLSGGMKILIDTVSGVIASYNGMLPQFARANNLTEEQVAKITSLATALKIVAGAAGGYLALSSAIKAATAAQAAFNVMARANPYIFIAASIGAATVAIYEFATAQDRTLAATERLWEDAAKSSAAYEVAMGRVSEGYRLNDELVREQFKLQRELDSLRQKGFKKYSRDANRAAELEKEISEILSTRVRLQNLRMNADKAEMDRRKKRQEEERKHQEEMESLLNRMNNAGSGEESEQIQKRIRSLEQERDALQVVGVEREKLKAVSGLSDIASNEDIEKIRGLADEIYRLEQIDEARSEIKKLGEDLSLAGLRGEELFVAQTKLKLGEFVQPGQAELVEKLAKSLYSAQQGMELLSKEDPIANEMKQYQERLENLQWLNEQQLLTEDRYRDLRAQAERAHQEEMLALQEQNFRAQSEFNDVLMASIDQFGSAATNAITGVLSGVNNTREALQMLAKGILSEVVGAFVQMGIAQVKALVMGKTAQAAAAAGYAASVAGQVQANTALAAQAAFASTAAIPIVGPGLAPGAAAAAATQAAALGAPALAASTAVIAGGRQYGGPVAAGNLYRVNENGRPEVFKASNGQQFMLPSSRGEVVSNADAKGEGGGTTVMVNVQNAPQGTTVNRRQIDGKEVIDIFIADIEGNGRAFKTLAARTGIKRRGR